MSGDKGSMSGTKSTKNLNNGCKPGFDKYGLPKKLKFKEYDLKTDKIVEVKKKKKVAYESDSDKSVERWMIEKLLESVIWFVFEVFLAIRK